MTRKDRAAELFFSGYNCAQSVAAAFADVAPLTEEQLLKIAAGFGGGFARTRSLCGAVSGMAMILGLMLSRTEAEDVNAENARIYAAVQQAREEFIERNGACNCGELLKNIAHLTSGGGPEKRSAEYYRKRPCVKLVEDAVEITEKLLQR